MEAVYYCLCAFGFIFISFLGTPCGYLLWAEKIAFLTWSLVRAPLELGMFFRFWLVPACQVRVVRFYVRCPAPPSSFPSFLLSFLPSSLLLLVVLLLAGPHLPALDRSGLPALDRSGPCRLARYRCGHRWTSTGEILRAVGLAGPQPARKNVRKNARQNVRYDIFNIR